MEDVFPIIPFPELFFALVAPIGVDINETVAALTSELENKSYRVFEVRVTDQFIDFEKDIKPDEPLVRNNQYERYKTYIKYGNQLRGHFEHNGILAIFTILQIKDCRSSIKSTDSNEYRGNAFIIRQFKRKEEIDILRSIYGRLLFQISIYSRRSSRVINLSRIFAEDSNESDWNLYRNKAEEIICTDENEASDPNGQRVQKIFHDADCIINTDISHPSVLDQVNRLVELIFGNNTLSPNRLEYGMFLAKAAALRTLDLSRQVGAAIFSTHGEIVSLGSNEVPKAGGGTYWADDHPIDAREYTIGLDSNDKRKEEILSEIFKKLFKEKAEEKLSEHPDVFETQFMDALEYGRIVHAEMSAITDAARTGRSVRDATLYCTTFPCHMCAKHIVSSGLRQVYYLEPYPKSLAYNLHRDSLEIDRGDRGRYSDYPAVNFTHFFGITPRRYRELFERSKRKDKKSRFQQYNNGHSRPNIDYIFEFYAETEGRALTFIEDAMKLKSDKEAK